MKPPILQTDWLNRVAFKPDSSADHIETFFVHAADPKHKNALSVWLNLSAHGKDRHGEVQCVVSVGDEHRVASERWPVQRIQIDPERAGVGIGESAIQEGASSGLVHGADFAISWDLALVDAAAGTSNLPAWLYKGSGVSPKLSTPHPAGVVSHGTVEVWHGLTRHVPLQRLDLTGWHIMQGHRWGGRSHDHSAWVLCNALSGAPKGSYFEAFSGAIRLGAMAQPDALVGRLVLGKEVFRFDTWRNLFAAAPRCSPTDWSFEMTGPDGRIKGTVKAAPAQTVASSGRALEKAVHRFTNQMAEITLELTPTHGAPRTLRGSRAFYEVVQPEPRGAAAGSARSAA